MWMMPLHLHVNQKSDYDDDDMAEMRQALTTFNSNNFVVYGQKHKAWVLVFLVRIS